MKLILFFIFSVFSLSQAAIEVPIEKLVAATVVLRDGEGCGTGFVLSSGNVVTNSHVISEACNQKVCSHIEVLQSTKLGEDPQRLGYRDFEIIGNFPASDMAILKPTYSLGIKGIDGKIATPIPDEEIFSIGFPHCKNLTVQHGKVVDLDPMSFGSQMAGHKGQSGSPVFNKNLDIVGLHYMSDSKNLGRATRIDQLGNHFDLINAESGINDLINMYKMAIENSSNNEIGAWISGQLVISYIDIARAETQLALSGQCPGLKDYWLWTNAGIPRLVPAPAVDGASLSPKCYELFQASVEFHTYDLLIVNGYPLDEYKAYKVLALRGLSPMAQFAENQYSQKLDDLAASGLVNRAKSFSKTYSDLGLQLSGALAVLVVLLFLTNFLFNRFKIFKKISLGLFAACLMSSLWFWWMTP